jgi:hypothetical protein
MIGATSRLYVGPPESLASFPTVNPVDATNARSNPDIKQMTSLCKRCMLFLLSKLSLSLTAAAS